jgi:hypothetical protein
MACKGTCGLGDEVRSELYALNQKYRAALEEIARLQAKLAVIRVGETGNSYFAIPDPPHPAASAQDSQGCAPLCAPSP